MKKGGFTLIEILVVVAIIGVLSSVVLASLANARAKANNAAITQQMAEYRKAISRYYFDHGHYPQVTVPLACLGQGYPNGCYYSSYPINENSQPNNHLLPYIRPTRIGTRPIKVSIAETWMGAVYTCGNPPHPICTTINIVWGLEGDVDCIIPGATPQAMVGNLRMCSLTLSNEVVQ